MNFSRFFRFLASVAMLATAGDVFAQNVTRTIPSRAAYGVMGSVDGNQVTIGSYTYRLAPGLQVRGRDNLIVLTETLRDLSGSIKVRYLVDMNGDLARVWILTADEITSLNPKAMPAQPLPQPSSPPLVAPGVPATSYSN